METNIEAYKLGRWMLFHDENQCEVRGTLHQKEDRDDRLVLTIALDWGGYYHASLMKPNYTIPTSLHP